MDTTQQENSCNMSYPSPPRKFFSQFLVMNNTDEHQVQYVSSAARISKGTNITNEDSPVAQPTSPFIFSNHDALQTTPFVKRQDSLSSIRFSSRLQLTTPSERMDFSYTSVSPSPAPSCDSSRRRMSFGLNTMGVDDDEDEEDEELYPGNLAEERESLPPLQDIDTNSGWTSPSPFKRKSNKLSMSLDASPSVSRIRFPTLREGDEENWPPHSLSQDSGMDILMQIEEDRADWPKFQPSKWKSNRSRTEISLAAKYKQTSLHDFFLPCGRTRSTFSASARELPRPKLTEFVSKSKSQSPAKTIQLDCEQSRSPYQMLDQVTDEILDPSILSTSDYEFMTTSFQIRTLRCKKLRQAIHGTGTLRTDASDWMNAPDIYQEDFEITPPRGHRGLGNRSSSSPPLPLFGRSLSIDSSTEDELILPVSKMTDDGCRCISPHTMHELLNDEYRDRIHHFVVIDCRFTYEYAAGHIKQAMHIQDRDLLLRMYKANRLLSENENKVIAWIFYCEFSQQRAPETATWFRKHDRKQHVVDYPSLSFPNVYVLEGGYSRFWSTFSQNPCAGKLFHRNAYVSMWDEKYETSRKNHAVLRKQLWSGGKGARKNKLRQRTRRRSRSVERECSGVMK